MPVPNDERLAVTVGQQALPWCVRVWIAGAQGRRFALAPNAGAGPPGDAGGSAAKLPVRALAVRPTFLPRHCSARL